MIRFTLLIALMLALCAGCDRSGGELQKRASSNDLSGTGVQVYLSTIDSGANQGKWHARFVLNEPQQIVFFSRSIGDYRLDTWQAVSADTKLERIGGFDTVSHSQPKSEFEFIFTPYTQGLAGDYTPFIPFSDGGLAVYTGQFELLVAQSKAELELLDGNLSGWQGHQPWTGVVIQSEQRMIDHGEIVHKKSVSKFFGQGHYVYLGHNAIIDTHSFIGVIDPQLPAWLRQRLSADLARIFAYLEGEFKRELENKPTVLFSFRGFTPEGLSNTGGAIGNTMLALEASGSLLAEENEKVLRYFHWFLAHEATHLFQEQSTHLSAPDDRWITEGGANAMANFVLRDLGLADTEYLASLAKRSYENCADFLASGKTLAQATQDPSQAHYSCGELFAYITDAALEGTSYTDFWRQLAVVPLGDTPVNGSRLYLDKLSQLGASQALVMGMEALIKGRSRDPHQQLLNLFTLSGVPYKLSADQRLASISF